MRFDRFLPQGPAMPKPETIDDETLTHLTTYFKEDVEKLKNISVDTSNWREY